jgi:2-polyprenyl-3-methyl-5-hydroxy-6-metoxy-1,4-benzoquinol methylase
MREGRICPWWCCFTIDNPLRRLFHNPERMLSPYIRPGFTVIDIGPGMGFFTIPMCRLVGTEGRVIAADVQQKMLDGVMRRARRHGLTNRLETVQSLPGDLGASEKADFVLAFWMVHEVQGRERFLRQVTALLKPEGRFLLVEPRLHVRERAFDVTLGEAKTAGLRLIGAPGIALSRSALFTLPLLRSC